MLQLKRSVRSLSDSEITRRTLPGSWVDFSSSHYYYLSKVQNKEKMGILQKNWNAIQKAAYIRNQQSSQATIESFIIAAVQYIVAQWIWCATNSLARKIDEIPPRTYVIVPMLMMWTFYSMIITMNTCVEFGGEYFTYRVGLVTLMFGGNCSTLRSSV